jgi:ribosomal protein S16
VDRWSNKYVFLDFDRLKFWVERGAKIHPSIYVLIRPAIAYHKKQVELHKSVSH